MGPEGGGVRGPASSLLLPPQASLVHTTETVRIRYFLDLLMEKSRPVMLVGNAGTGKSVLMGDKLDSLSTDEYLVQAVPFNFYTTSAMLQGEGGRGLGRGVRGCWEQGQGEGAGAGVLGHGSKGVGALGAGVQVKGVRSWERVWGYWERVQVG